MPRFLLTFLALILATPCAADAPRPVEFNRDVRPILSDACFQCHGPDKANRKAGLRFDVEADAFADLGGYHAIVPGQPAKSEMLRRILAPETKKRMPPASAARRLTAAEIDVLRRWVEQGAKWQKHWSLLPPRRPALPAVKNARWPRNPLDHFVLARLERAGLRPSPETDRVTLLRRVTLDLTGLPPTPAEVDAFLADKAPSAYEKLVDRLLASPRYGERMAIKWLDGARYADTNGYQGDGERVMWRWRDWVIDAINHNMPFDRFTVEQLAGDLLPGATVPQKIATGFNRNHRGNAEGGIVPAEYAVEYVVDRVDTTGTVFLGLTLGCARCHDHKYDPVSQKEFYRLFAYFNNVPERGKVVRFGNSPPMMASPTREQQKELARLEAELKAAEAHCAELGGALDRAQSAWEKTFAGRKAKDAYSFLARLVAHFPLNRPHAALKPMGGDAVYVPGRIGKAVACDGQRFLEAGNVGHFGFTDKFSLSAWIYPEGDAGGTILSRMADNDRAEGYALALKGGRVYVHLAKRWLDDAIHVHTADALAAGRWHHVLMTYDGSRLAQGVKVYVDGSPRKLTVLLDDLNQDFKTANPLRLGWGGGGRLVPFRGRIDEVRVYDDRLAPEDAALLATVETIQKLVRTPPAARTAAQTWKVRSYFLANHAPDPIRQVRVRVLTLRKRLERFLETVPTTMVMEEMSPPRPTHVLIRGEYDKKGPQVTPGVPASLPPLPSSASNNRLGFARWLVEPSNPLTARVTVNRYWQMYFGTGLVKTAEDFGSQGEWPSHPELLDWLATEFVRTGWDVKAMQRAIVTSATYRQSSRVTKDLLQRDPLNRLLARGPRLRLSAEMIRDQALAVSGLLVERVGGPSVRPYQPPNLWKDLANDEYVQDGGKKLYRRSLYTFWKRTIAPPAMLTFDAAGREACVVRETRTNTPLQALNLLNDVTYVEAARALAERVLRAEKTPEARLTLAFRRVTARTPRPVELAILRAGLNEHLTHYRGDHQAALKLVSAGESRRDERLDVGELAAYTAVASLILNLDEAITKE